MGMRGPGAKPKKRTDAVSKPPKRARGTADWRNDKLSMPDRVIAFMEELPITAGKLAGQQMKLREWQKDFIKAVYGPQREGKRLVRTALLSLPRKNGKSQIAAGLALAHLCGPCAEMRGQVYSAASDRNQAAIIFKEMVAIIERVEWMEERLNIRSFNKLIEDVENGSTYEALSSDARKAHDPSRLLARTKSGTLRLEEDSKGLRFELDLPDTTEGRDLLALAERGDIGGMKGDIGKFLYGFTCIFFIAIACYTLGANAFIAANPTEITKLGITWSLGLSTEAGLIVALVVGILLGNLTPGFAESLREACRPELFVKIAIVILGAELGVKAADAAGFAGHVIFRGLCAIVEAYLLYWSVVYYVARKYFKFNKEWAAPLASGISICGVSAAIATGGAIRARPVVPIMPLAMSTWARRASR